MNAQTKIEAAPVGLDLLRAPFPDNLVSKLPKPTKAQTEAVRNNFQAGIRCELCGAWHHPKVEHLDYVGHAALTHRLLDADPAWHWEPVAFGSDGLPAFDQSGGLWIKLTVCGQTRLGYGHGERKTLDKTGGDRIKEVIGDALRNAAMRFGAALDLWHKGDLHLDDTAAGEGHSDEREVSPPTDQAQDVEFINDNQAEWIINMLDQHNIPAAKLLKAAGIRTVTSLPAGEYEKARTWVNAQIAAKEMA